MSVAAANQAKKTVADPLAAYTSVLPLWERSRAACSGERYVKAYDGTIDKFFFSNLLIPFSPSMSEAQYQFYKAEAEYPGIVAQYAKIVVGGLLRKKPQLKLPDSVPEEAMDWILNTITQDDNSLSAFLDEVLWEELQTSRAWVYVDYPNVPNKEQLSTADFKKFKPYPVKWEAETVINWAVSVNKDGKRQLSRVIVKGYEEVFKEDNEFHPDFIETLWVHELVNEKYQVRKFQLEDPSTSVTYVNGKQVKNKTAAKPTFKLIETITSFEMNNKPIPFIPAWPLNGMIEPQEPMLGPIIDKEVSLYNKMSRRNHLLYGASTYTPVISTDMSDDEFDKMVDSGLGTWLRLRVGETASVLETPTAALQDMEKAIAANIEEMAKMGIRMLTPETDQSGVALDIRNAAQTAQLGTLNMKVSSTMSAIIAFMLNWRYDIDVKASDVDFTLSSDFNPAPLGADWLRLVTEWYENGLVPRSIWLQILKMNDIVPPDYDDEEGQKEITEDETVVSKREQQDFEAELTLATAKAQGAAPAKPAPKMKK